MPSINKYVIVNGQPILFPSSIVHSDVISGEAKAESAGFFVVNVHKEAGNMVFCGGESTSLEVSSKPEKDQKIIADFLGLFSL